MHVRYLVFLVLITTTLSAQTTITVDRSKRFQTIDGWEATSNRLEATSVRDTLLPHLPRLIDIAVNDVGITRLRLGVNSGLEDTVDHFSQVLSGTLSYDDYKLHRYYKINDNDDPFVADPRGFQMGLIDHNVQHVIRPFKNAVEARGDRFYLNICFVDFADQSPFHHTRDPEEYAEFMTYMVQYLDTAHGIAVDGIEIILEPDNADVWLQRHIPGSIAAVGARLQGLGYSPEIIAPSVLNLRTVPKFLDEIVNNPTALDYLDVLCYHRYSGNNDTVAQLEIAALAEQYGKKTAMLEYDKNGDIGELHVDLKYVNNVAWTKYALAYKSDEQFAYVFVDPHAEGGPAYGIGMQTKYLRQYFRYIRPGATRIEAAGGSPEIDPIAFEHPDGRQVVVVKADVADTIVITGLAPGSYNISYTLGNYNWGNVAPRQFDVHLPLRTIDVGQEIKFYMPDQGAATIAAVDATTSVRKMDGSAQVHRVLRTFFSDVHGRTIELPAEQLPPGVYLQVTVATDGVQAEKLLVTR